MRLSLAASAVVAALGAFSACSKEPGGRGDCPEPGDLEPGAPLLGFRPLALTLGTNGGYLGAAISFGDCHESEGHVRIYRLAQTQTAVVVTALDDNIEFASRMAVLTSGDQVALAQDGSPTVRIYSEAGGELALELPGPISDLQAAGRGWIASAGAAGSFFIDSTTLVATALPAAPSICGGPGAGRWLLCEGASLQVVDTSGALVTSLALPADATFMAGSESAGLVLLSDNDAAIVAGDSLAMVAPLAGEAGKAWVSLDGTRAILGGPNFEQHLDFDTGVIDSISTIDVYGGMLVDAAFAGDKALKGYLSGTIAVRDLATEVEDVFPSGNEYLWEVQPVLVERFGANRVLFAPTRLSGEASPGDEIFLPIYDVSVGAFLPAIPLVLE